MKLLVVYASVLLVGAEIGPVTGKETDARPVTADPPSIVADLRSVADLLGDGNALRDLERQRAQRAQELTAECMASSGFAYIPQQIAQGEAGENRATSMDESRARSIGYGFSAGFFAMIESDSNDPNALFDPNDEIVEALEPEAVAEYQLALWGSAPDGGGTSRQGCFAAAMAQAYPEDEWAALRPAVSELERTINQDPRLQPVEAAWAECMAEAGFGFASKMEVWGHLQSRIQQLLQPPPSAHEAHDHDGSPGSSHGHHHGGAHEHSHADQHDHHQPPDRPHGSYGVIAGSALDAVDPRTRRALIEEEIAIALADLECSRPNDPEQLRRTIAREHQLAFIERNRRELERVLAQRTSSATGPDSNLPRQ